jgi:hypothetical protein
MKMARFFFVLMIAAVLLLGPSLAQEGDHPSQQVVSRNGEKSADQQKDEAGNDEDHTRAKPAGETQEQSATITRSATKARPSVSHSKPAPTYRARSVRKPTANSPRNDEPGSIAPVEQMGSKTVSNIPNKAVSRRSPSVPSSAVSVNGQQFKSSRNPGAHLAASGGPATTARGTAAINGTEMKRKP